MKLRMKFKSSLLLGRDLNPYFEHKKMNPNFNLFTGSVGFILAERAGFEPAVRVNVRTLSKRVPSATQPPLRIRR